MIIIWYMSYNFTIRGGHWIQGNRILIRLYRVRQRHNIIYMSDVYVHGLPRSTELPTFVLIRKVWIAVPTENLPAREENWRAT